MKKVLLTGGTGYIAGWVAATLLQRGYEVHASLRTFAKGEPLRHSLSSLVKEEQLKNLFFFEADLLNEESWLAPMQGMEGVFHVASPLGSGTESTETLVNIAENGTLNVLKAALKAGVSHVIMTSSGAAATPESKVGAVTLDESFWTDLNNPELDAYRISKTEAEKAAWTFVKETPMHLTTVLPGAVFGPVITADSISSASIILNIMNGYPLNINIPLEVSDTRDLAELHVLAFEQPVARGKRYLAAGQHSRMPDISKVLKKAFPNYARQISTFIPPNWLIKLLACFQPSLRSFIPMLNRQYRYTTQQAKTDLHWAQRPAEQTFIDTANSLIATGLVKKK